MRINQDYNFDIFGYSINLKIVYDNNEVKHLKLHARKKSKKKAR